MVERPRIVPGNRAENRAAMEAEILRLGREHLCSFGASNLSLRAIARDLGVVSSAVYRYVASRDELLTALLVEAYNDLADATTAAVDAAGDAARDRLLAAARAVRQWGVGDPSRWALLYGSPVIGYDAPPEVTTEPGTRVIALLLQELARAEEQGLLSDPVTAVTPSISADLEAAAAGLGTTASATVVAEGTLLWSVIIGGVDLEVFDQYGREPFTDLAVLFDHQVDSVLDLLFD